MLKADDRKRAIVEALTAKGSASVEDMAERFGVSRMTIHRDLDELAAAGLVRKVRGGATVSASQGFMADFTVRRMQAVEEKARLARAALALVEPGDTVVVDDGSTSAAVGEALVDIRPLTVITNNLSVIERLSASPGHTVIALGGEYSRKFNGFFGLLAETAIKGLRADVALISCSAIHGTKAFHQDGEVVQAKRLKMAAATRRYLLVNGAKFGKPALHFLSDLADFDMVLTETPPKPDHIAELEEAGVHLQVVE